MDYPLPGTHSYDATVITHTDASTLRAHSADRTGGRDTAWEFPGTITSHTPSGLALLARMIETGRVVESFEANNGHRVIYRFAA